MKERNKYIVGGIIGAAVGSSVAVALSTPKKSRGAKARDGFYEKLEHNKDKGSRLKQKLKEAAEVIREED